MAEGTRPVLVPGMCSWICCHVHAVPNLTLAGSDHGLDVLNVCVGSQGTSALQSLLVLAQTCRPAWLRAGLRTTFFLGLAPRAAHSSLDFLPAFCWQMKSKWQKWEKITEKAQDLSCQFLHHIVLLSPMFGYFYSAL